MGMPHNTSFLNPLQKSVLAWIAGECPPGIVEGHSHRITAKALEARGLITINGKGQTWIATITEAGSALLERNLLPPDESTANAAAFLQDVLDAGGLIVTEDRRNGPADMRMLEVALGAPNRPFGKKLARQSVGGWVSDTTEWFLAAHFPDFVERRVVPLVASTRSFHPVVAAYRENRDGHRVSKDHLQRAELILQALAAEAERRGYGTALPFLVTLRPSGSRSVDVSGQLALVIGENVFGIAISEVPGTGGVRLPYQPNPRLPAWQRARKFSFVPTGRLELTITNWSSAQRKSSFKDTRSVTVESFLSDVLFELEVRSLEADWDHDEEARKAAEKQARWQRAMAAAEAALHESRRVTLLRDQVARSSEAEDVRRFIASARGAQLDLAVEVMPAPEWLAWAESYANRIDPLLGPLPMPADSAFKPDELKPFLGGWNPYGVDR